LTYDLETRIFQNNYKIFSRKWANQPIPGQPPGHEANKRNSLRFIFYNRHEADVDWPVRLSTNLGLKVRSQ